MSSNYIYTDFKKITISKNVQIFIIQKESSTHLYLTVQLFKIVQNKSQITDTKIELMKVFQQLVTELTLKSK